MDLQSYRSVAMGRKPPAYLQDSSLLDAKIEMADRIARKCNLCERRCGIDRTAGEVGFCGVGRESRYFFEQTLWGEEAPLVPSYEVFFSGCNMRCKYCYSWEAVLDPTRGQEVVPRDFARLVDFRREEGATNLNLIGGEPTVNLPSILRALRLVSHPTPVVWNSNFYMTENTMALLDGIVDLFLGDFRFGNDRCANEIASTDRYFEAASRNFKMAAESADLIIRHLVMPGHVECCLRPIAEWVAANLPDTPFNLMFQYVPCHEAMNHPILGRSLTQEEEAKATEIVESLRLNTDRWNKPLPGRKKQVGSGEISTSINIHPDGRVSIMHLHGHILQVVEALKGREDNVRPD